MSDSTRTNRRVVVTGGPTRAYLDKVRFLSNVSTGSVAFLTAKELVRSGCEVSAVVGPTPLDFSRLGLAHLASVETHRDMREVVLRECRRFKPDVVVFAAAVLDFEPVRQKAGKVASRGGEWVVRLRPTPKIIDLVGKEFPKIRRVGFKLEWKNPGARKALRFAVETLEAKKLDALCLNYLSEIKSETQHPSIFVTREGEISFGATKADIARLIKGFVNQR